VAWLLDNSHKNVHVKRRRFDTIQVQYLLCGVRNFII